LLPVPGVQAAGIFFGFDYPADKGFPDAIILGALRFHQ
jgi:hypothetical protein